MKFNSMLDYKKLSVDFTLKLQEFDKSKLLKWLELDQINVEHEQI
jgi:hypothetical protein